MGTFAEFMSNAVNYIKLVGISDIFDIAIVAFLIYKLIGFIKKTNLMHVFKGLVVILVVLWLSGVLKLTMINWLLKNIVELGLIALVIIFHPELRRFLEKVGSSRIIGIFGGEYKAMNVESAITQTVLACADLSRTRTGALIVFERETKLGEIISTEGRAKYNMQSSLGDRDIYKGLTFWSPNINIFRDPRWGRGHETYGEDPFLCLKRSYEYLTAQGLD